ncbi:MAG: D-alanine--D-alanine ligase [Chloroflexi bacterium]|nr:D-alanine--D-alanine ligase [Chloroflexota bacterium]
MVGKDRYRIGVFFGGRSVEHDVSIVTAQQVMHALEEGGHTVLPIYIDRSGNFYQGATLREIANFETEDWRQQREVAAVLLSPQPRQHGLIVEPLAGRFRASRVQRMDVAFPALHGSHGEDGSLQGLLELADIPYVGCGVLASALANDKWMTKAVLREADLPVLDGFLLERDEWLRDSPAIVAAVQERLKYPLIVKPARTGSSIGIGFAEDEASLRAATDIAIAFDHRVLLEERLTDCREINCAVLGDGQGLRASPLEQPLSYEEFLSYEEKYLRGGGGMKSAERIIPAPIGEALTEAIQEAARATFAALAGRGTARMDFLLKRDESAFYLNEVNTMPGSLAFYLWQEAGLKPTEVCEALLEIAFRAAADKRGTRYDHRTELLGQVAARGLKGAKGAKTRAGQ